MPTEASLPSSLRAVVRITSAALQAGTIEMTFFRGDASRRDK